MIIVGCGKPLPALVKSSEVGGRMNRIHESCHLSYRKRRTVRTRGREEWGDIPADFAVTMNRDNHLLTWNNLLRMPFAVPCEYRSVHEVIFCFIGLENREVSLSKGLLCRSDCRVLECQTQEIDLEISHVFQRDSKSRPAWS